MFKIECVTHSILNLLTQTELFSACTLPYALKKIPTKSVKLLFLEVKNQRISR